MKYFAENENILIEHLKTSFPNLSINKIRKMLSNNRVSVDGVIVNKAKTNVEEGQIIEVNENAIFSKDSKIFKIDIIFEDEEIIVLNKPTKLLSVATDKLENDTLHSRVVNYLKSKEKSAWAWIIHRLDKETSGIMLFAKNEKTKLAIQKQFSEKSVRRKYIGIVEGKPYANKGVIENYLVEGKDLFVRECKKSTKGAKIAKTNWKILETNHNYSLIEIFIETGRRNQIRVHFSGIKCPISGDKKYGSKTNPLKRLCLHAEEISIIHPKTSQESTFYVSNPFNKIFN